MQQPFSFYPSDKPSTAYSSVSTAAPEPPQTPPTQLIDPNTVFSELLSNLEILSSELSTKLTLCTNVATSQFEVLNLPALNTSLISVIKPALSRFKRTVNFILAHPNDLSFQNNYLSFFSTKKAASLVVQTGAVLVKGVLMLPDSYYGLITESFKREVVDSLMKVLQYSYLVLSMLASLLDFLTHEHYIYEESTIASFSKENIVKSCLMPIFVGNEKIREVFSDIERWKKADQQRPGSPSRGRPNNLVNKFVQILYQLMNSQALFAQNETAFLSGEGVQRIIEILKKSFRNKDFELYCYTIGLIPALLQGDLGRKQVTSDYRLLKLLCNHFGKLYDPVASEGDQEESKSPVHRRGAEPSKSPKHYIYMASPILISLRALVHHSSSQLSKLVDYESVIQNVLRLSFDTFQNDNRGRLRNVYHSCNILLGQISNGSKEGASLISKDLMPAIYEEQKGEQDVRKEIYNLWKEECSQQIEYARVVGEALVDIRENNFDDQLIISSLEKLTAVFNKNKQSKKVLSTLNEGIRTLISHLKNIDLRVREATLKTMAAFILGETSTSDQFLKNKGLFYLASCLDQRQTNLGLRKLSLNILINLLGERGEAVQLEIAKSGIFPQIILQIIQHFPAHNVNLEVFKAALTTLTLVLTDNVKNQEIFKKNGGLQALIKQLKELIAKLQTPQKFSADQVKQYQEAFATLSVATNNAIYGNPQNQELLRELGILQTAHAFLKYILTRQRASTHHRHWDSDLIQALKTDEGQSMQSAQLTEAADLQQQKKHGDQLAIHTIYLLINSIDTNVESQEKLASLDKMPEMLLILLQNDHDFKIAGRGCLLLHHLVWNSKKNKQIFGTKEFVLEVIRIAGFHPNSDLTSEYSPEVLYQANLYALLAIINLTQDEPSIQQRFGAHGAVKVLTDLLGDDNFQAKKTVCFCLSNITRGNPANAKQLAGSGGIPMLAELINDEEDDQLSNKAFSVIESLGEVAGFELLQQILILCQKVPLTSDLAPNSNVLLLNLSSDSSLFKFCSQAGSKQAKSLEKGLKHSSESAQAIYKLQKLLPILNGLIYMQEPVKFSLLHNFKYQSPFAKKDNQTSALGGVISLLYRALPYNELEQTLYILNNLSVGLSGPEDFNPMIQGLINYVHILSLHQKLLMQKKIRLFEVAAAEGSVVSIEIEFEMTESEEDHGMNFMKCFRIHNNKRTGEYLEASVFLPDDILASLREQRGLIYSLLVKLSQGKKGTIEKMISGGSSKIEFGKCVASDLLTFFQDENKQKLVKEASEMLLLMAQYLVEWKGGFGGLAATQNWKECIKKLIDMPTSSSNVAIKARAGQVYEQLKI